MFEVGGEYSNRIGRYTVLEVGESKMTVEYQDGSTAELSINIQARIWNNIAAEKETQNSKSARKSKPKKSLKNRFHIRTVPVLAAAEILTPGKQTKFEASEQSIRGIRPGDRVIFYAVDSEVFFAVVTITAAPSKVKGSASSKREQLYLLSVDVDVFAPIVDRAVQAASIELESLNDVQKTLANSEEFVEINENDFELLAELLAEFTEEDDDLDDSGEEEEEYDD